MNKSRNLLVLTSAFPRWQGDGRDMFIYELSKRLTKEFNVYVLAPRDKRYCKLETYDGMTIYKHNQSPFNLLRIAYGSGILPNIKKNPLLYFVVPVYFIYQLFYLIKLIKKHKIEVIHAHWTIPNGLIAVIYKIWFNRKIKILMTGHGADLLGLNFYLGTKMKMFILRKIDQLSVVSNHLKKKALSLGYKKEIYVYPMGIDTEIFVPGGSNMFGNKRPVILFVGIDFLRKGLNYLVAAMPEIIQKYPDTQLVVIGESNQRSIIEDLAKENNMISNIQFLGSIQYSELPPYFADADIFTLPSLSEGFGLVVIEAMSCGTITIVSDLPPFYDIVTDNETGFYVKLRDSKDLARRIIEAMDNSENSTDIKRKARQYVIENFDWKIVAQNYTNLINTMF